MAAEDAIRAFEDAVRKRGIIPPPGGIVADGKIKRCAVEGTPHKKDATYILFPDHPISGGFQNWRDGKGWENWTSGNSSENGLRLTAEEVRAAKARQEKINQAREQERADRQTEAAADARKTWEAAKPADPSHPYLTKKKIKPNGLRMDGKVNLLGPMMDESGTLVNLQRIDASGGKRFLPGGKVVGTFSSFGPTPDPSGPIVIVEGISTGLSVFEATGIPVISAMSADNLPAVARIFRARYSKAKLIIFADNDTKETHGHTRGIEAAEAAAKDTGAYIAISPGPGDDANDLYAREGAEAVRAAIDAAMGTGAEKTGPKIVVLEEMEAESARNLLSTPTPPVDEVFAGLLARGEVLTLGGPPKSGKSYFALQAALCGAAGEAFLGCDVPHPFKVLYVIAEGSKRRLKDRLLNSTPYIPGIEDEDFDRLYVVDTRGMLQIDTDAGEKTLLRLAEPFDLIILDTLYALQGGGDENSHKDFRAVSGPLNRLKHSAGGKAVLLIHHVRKNSGEDAGADELRGAGFAGFSDAVVRLYKRRGRMGIHYELKFDLRNYAEREDLLLTRMGPLFAPMDTSSSKVDLQNYVVATITERGGRVEGRESLIKILIALTKMKRQSCINAITAAITAGKIDSAPMPGTNAKVYFLTDGNDDEE